MLWRSFSSESEAMIWIINNQLGRRNLSDFQKIELVQTKKEILAGKGKEKRQENLKRGTEIPEKSLNDKSGKTQKQIAKEAGMSKGHIAGEGEEKESGGRGEVWQKTSQAKAFIIQ